MNDDMSVFRFEQFDVRVMMRDGEPWWVGKDVCGALGLSNHRSSLSALDEDERGVEILDSPSGQQHYVMVNEPGLYSLIMRSRKPEAKAFKRWITHVVLPEIRKTGTYGLVERWGLPANYAEALEAHLRDQWEIDRQNQVIAVLEPKAQFTDLFLQAGGSMSMSDVAKSLHALETPILISPIKIFNYLESIGWIYRHRRDHKWRAVQEFMNKGYLIQRAGSEYQNRQGHRQVGAPTVRCTARGFYALHELLSPPEERGTINNPEIPLAPVTEIGRQRQE